MDIFARPYSIRQSQHTRVVFAIFEGQEASDALKLTKYLIIRKFKNMGKKYPNWSDFFPYLKY